MKRTLILLTALAASATTSYVYAQAPAAAPAPATAVAPQAIPAKIALINFQQVVLASNEGQTVTATTQKKYEPKKAELERLSTEIDTLKKNLQAAPATLSDADRATRLREIDTKEKHLNQDAQEATEAYNAEWQEALSKVAQKIAGTMRSYAKQAGFTILLDVSTESSNVLWAADGQDVSQAVVDAYNKQSGIAAPPPQGPAAAPRTTPRPSAPKPSGK